MYIHKYSSPLGIITLTSDGDALTGLYFEHQREDFGNSSANTSLPIFDQTAQWLDCYFSGNVPNFTPKLNTQGTAFRETVWNILKTIPYGQTMTYGEIANIIGKEKGIKKMSAQAVGGAVGSNPISIIIPCHRVIGSNGALVGYAGGIELKRQLLRIEKII